MQNLNKPCAYILTLQSESRNQALIDDCNRLNIAPNIFPAIDLRKVRVPSHDTYRALRFDWLDRDLTNGEIGCIVSHRGIIEDFLRTQSKATYVFEDDAVISDARIQDFRDLYEFICSVNTPMIISLFRSKFSLFRLYRNKKIVINDNVTLIKPARPTYGTVGYLINKEAAQIISDTESLLISPADWPIEWIGKIEFYTLIDQFVFHDDDAKSTIEGERALEQMLPSKKSISGGNLFSRNFRYLFELNKISKIVDSENQQTLVKYRLIELCEYGFPILYRLFIRKVDSSDNFKRRSSLSKFIYLPKYIYWRIIRRLYRSFLNYFLMNSRIGIKKLLSIFGYKIVKRELHLNSKETYSPAEIIRFLNETGMVQKSSRNSNNSQLDNDFALVITIYNQTAHQLNRCLEGLKSQSLIPDQILWIDGGSTSPDTLAWIDQNIVKNQVGTSFTAKWSGSKFVQIENIGIVRTRNLALEYINTRYVVFHDPDDQLTPNFFQELKKTAELNLAAQIIYPNVFIRNENGNVTNYWETGPTDLKSFLTSNRIPASSCIDLNFIRALGGYRLEMEMGMEDWDLWVRASLVNSFFVHSPRAEYFYSENLPASRTIHLRDFESSQRKKIFQFVLNYLEISYNNS